MKSKNQFLNSRDKTKNHADRKEIAYLMDQGVEKAIIQHIQGKAQIRWK